MSGFKYKKPDQFFEWQKTASEQEIWEYIDCWHKYPESTSQLIDFINYINGLQEKVKFDGRYTDCSGTGGDGSNTFNISTAAAFVAASCGVPIAKHGARRTAGSSGSVDVLEKLKVQFSSELNDIVSCLKKNELAFISSKMSAELFKKVKKVVVEHKSSSFLSFVGPCSNPLPIAYQLLGVGRSEWIPRVAELLKGLKREKALVVHGKHSEGGLDEFSLSDVTLVREITRNSDGTYKDIEYEVSPEMFGFKRVNISHFKGGSAEINADRIKGILSGDSHQHDVEAVALNAGGIVYIGGMASSLEDGVKMCLSAISNGKALAKLNALQTPKI